MVSTGRRKVHGTAFAILKRLVLLENHLLEVLNAHAGLVTAIKHGVQRST
jgi:hypothetical protein